MYWKLCSQFILPSEELSFLQEHIRFLSLCLTSKYTNIEFLKLPRIADSKDMSRYRLFVMFRGGTFKFYSKSGLVTVSDKVRFSMTTFRKIFEERIKL